MGVELWNMSFLIIGRLEDLGMVPHVVQIYDDQQMIEEIQIETLTITDQIPPQMFVKNTN